jgi:hypothetical protein
MTDVDSNKIEFQCPSCGNDLKQPPTGAARKRNLLERVKALLFTLLLAVALAAFLPAFAFGQGGFGGGFGGGGGFHPGFSGVHPGFGGTRPGFGAARRGFAGQPRNFGGDFPRSSGISRGFGQAFGGHADHGRMNRFQTVPNFRGNTAGFNRAGVGPRGTAALNRGTGARGPRTGFAVRQDLAGLAAGGSAAALAGLHSAGWGLGNWGGHGLGWGNRWGWGNWGWNGWGWGWGGWWPGWSGLGWPWGLGWAGWWPAWGWGWAGWPGWCPGWYWTGWCPDWSLENAYYYPYTYSDYSDGLFATPINGISIW